MPQVTIQVRKNGPYRIEAINEINLIDHDGNPIPIPPGKTVISLCRCGASVTKPFCDGTHSRIGFKGAEEAAAEFDATRPLP
jgi:CDGSH-type Zn-finger protein